MQRKNGRIVVGLVVSAVLVGAALVYLVQAPSYRRAVQHMREHPGVFISMIAVRLDRPGLAASAVRSCVHPLPTRPLQRTWSSLTLGTTPLNGSIVGRTMTVLEEITIRLDQQGCATALNHLRQAQSALARSEWESASAQVRASIEALFDQIAAVTGVGTKKGGAGRKELEQRGVLSERQARLVQSFVDYAGSGGAHAGRTNQDEARARFWGGVGLIFLGLSLIPALVRVQDVFDRARIRHPGTDAEFETECPSCKSKQHLNECSIQRDGLDTVYTCRNGCQLLVVVAPPGDSPWPGRGYRLGDYVVRNAADMYRDVNGKATVKSPASAAALMKRRPDVR